MDWLVQNLGTICIAMALLAMVSGIVFGMIKDRKKGKSPCGCDCGHCGACGSCHNK